MLFPVFSYRSVGPMGYAAFKDYCKITEVGGEQYTYGLLFNRPAKRYTVLFKIFYDYRMIQQRDNNVSIF
jgi:hypothetical protein